MIINKLFFCLIFTFYLLLITPIYAMMNIWIDMEVIRNPIFKEAFEHRSLLDYSRALEDFQRIVDQYPGTEYAANAQLCKIEIYDFYLPNCQKAIQEYQRMLINYPNTKYWLIAKEALLDQTTDFQAYLSNVNNLIMEVGGESVFNIIQGNSKNYNVSRIAPQFQLVIAEFYTGIAATFEMEKKTQETMRFWSFIRENFPNFQRYSVIESMSDYVLESKGITDKSAYQKDTPPPKMRIITPLEGTFLKEDQPRVEFELKSGDICGSQVDLSKLQFTIDGQDLTEKMKIKSTLDTSAKPGVPFETLNIYYTPEQPLASGTHTVYVKAVDTGGKVRQRTWTFKVI